VLQAGVAGHSAVAGVEDGHHPEPALAHMLELAVEFPHGFLTRQATLFPCDFRVAEDRVVEGVQVIGVEVAQTQARGPEFVHGAVLPTKAPRRERRSI
jgi:hypothetical protein